MDYFCSLGTNSTNDLKRRQRTSIIIWKNYFLVSTLKPHWHALNLKNCAESSLYISK